MYDLTETTFITFVKLDNEARVKNLKSMVNFYRNHCKNYQHVIVEEDDKPTVPEHIHIDTNMVHIFTKSDGEWRKCEGYNKGIKLAKTQYIIFNDIDIIVNPSQLVEAIGKLKSPDAGLIVPFNGICLNVSNDIKDNFCTTLDYDELDKHFPTLVDSYDGTDVEPGYAYVNKTEGEVLIMHINSTGGCIVGRRDTLIRCNGYNPNFAGWGFEDDEVVWRITKMGYPCGRITGVKKPCWHLPHDDYHEFHAKRESQPNYETNKKLYFKIRDMDKDQITQYGYSWRL